jgi:hypothetical protein
VPVRAYEVFSGKPLSFEIRSDRTVHISGIDRSASPVDTIVAITFDKPVMTFAHRL